MKSSPNYLFLAFALLFFACQTAIEEQGKPGVKADVNVIIIGLDGLMPDALTHANTPYLDELMENGSYTLKGRAIRPTVSSPNWATMIMGAGPSAHGITANAWRRDTFDIPPMVTGTEDIFPSIFSLLHWNRLGRKSAAVYHWSGFGRFIEHSVIDIVIDTPNEREAALETARIILEGQPELIFVQIDHVDGAGHRHGFMQPGYFESVELADTLVGKIIEATRQAGTYENTVFIVASDHGGIGTGHGGDTMEELTIFAGLSGPGVRSGVEVTDPVYIFDIAATAAYFLGITPPRAWYGKPIYCAIEGYECEKQLH